MKKIFIIALLLIAASANTNAQALLSTKAGVAKFNATGDLVKIEAVNNQVDCKMLPTNGQIIFTLLIKGFRFENQLMEDHFNENYLESTQFPKASFKGFVTNIASVNFNADGVYKVEAEGTLNIHGVDQKIKVPGTITVKSGKANLKSDFKVKLSDYKIAGSYIGEKIAAEASVQVNCNF